MIFVSALWFNIIIFVFSCALLAFSGKWLIESLTRIAKFLCLKEFIVAFFTITLAASAPNLFVGVVSALRGASALSLGDVIGGNVIDLTLVVFLAVFIGKSAINTDSRVVQDSALFTAAIAVFPLFLILDGVLSRGDGIALIVAFIFYIFWMFSKKERYCKVYDGEMIGPMDFLKDLVKSLVFFILIFVASMGIVQSAMYFSEYCNLPLVFIGILVVGLGNALPEAYFAVVLARGQQNWMVLGDLMASVISCATLVLGIVAIISPIQVASLPTVAVARLFMILSAVLFLVFIKTGKKIDRREAVFLLALYVLFTVIEIIILK